MQYPLIVLEKERKFLDETIESNIYFSKTIIEIKKEQLSEIDKAISILKAENKNES